MAIGGSHQLLCTLSECGGSVAVVGRQGFQLVAGERRLRAGQVELAFTPTWEPAAGLDSCTDGYQALASTTGGSCCTRVWNVSCTPPPPSPPPPSAPSSSPPPPPHPPPSSAAACVSRRTLTHSRTQSSQLWISPFAAKSSC